MNENLTVTINSTELPIQEYQGQRVVTLREIDMVHERPEGTARKRFNDNKQHFIQGTDFFQLDQPSEIRTLGIERPQGGTPQSVTLITESGYLMLVKSFTDDLAWTVQRQLVNTYFRATDAERKDAARRTKQQTAKRPALSSVNMAMKLQTEAAKAAGMAPEYILAALAKAYDPYGIAVPADCLPEAEKLYECEEIARELGILSESRKPHGQAVAAIIKLVGADESEKKVLPFSKDAYSNVTVKYKRSVLDKVRGWLADHQYPSSVSGGRGNYKIAYESKEELENQ